MFGFLSGMFCQDSGLTRERILKEGALLASLLCGWERVWPMSCDAPCLVTLQCLVFSFFCSFSFESKPTGIERVTAQECQ